MKICFIIEGLYNSGGMERVLSTCANALSHDIDVSILTLCQGSRDYFFPMNSNVGIYDLGFIGIINKKELKKRLGIFLKSHRFDIVVSLGGMDFFFLHSIKDGSKKMVWFHFAINIAETSWIGSNPTFLQKICARLRTWNRIYHARKYKKIIVISNADFETWNKYSKNAVLIYNPITIGKSCNSERNSKSVISVGRLDFQKGYDYLINAWLIVSKKYPDWHLDIYGEGSLKCILQKQIDKLLLNNSVTLRGRVSDIEAKYHQYSFYVMSSRAEGFPLVLLEAASCGLPLVAFDCPSGPGEIIEDGKSGYLIKRVGDIDGLAEAIIRLIENPLMREQMGSNALRIADKFSIQKISKHWVELFESSINSL